MKVQPIRGIDRVRPDAPKLTHERVLEFIKEFKGLDNDSSTVVELNSTSELPAFLYDKTGKIK